MNNTGYAFSKSFLSIFSLLLGLVSSLYAQPSRTGIRGIVADGGTGDPLPYARVGLLQVRDSALVQGTISDEAGAFALQADAGSYLLQVSFLGYAPLFRAVDIQTGQTLDLGTQGLEAAGMTLDEVVVSAERSRMELTLDKKVFHVGQDLANMGGSAADVLGNIPTVSVDPDGNISLRGSSNVRILIDGKPSGLISFKGAEGLQQLQGSLIERVEIINNPSARYEAEGMGGIINIVLKKDRKKGLNGAFDITAGYPTTVGTSFSMNYRREKINFFLNYGIAYRDRPGNSSLYQEVYDGDTILITQQDMVRTRQELSNNVRAGFDLFLNPRNTLTTSFAYNHSRGGRTAELIYRDYLFDLENPTGITNRVQDEVEIEPNMEYVLTYKRTFAREGHELVAELRYQDNSELSLQDFVERYYLPGYQATDRADNYQRSSNDESERQTLLQVDYVHPFGKDGRFEAGLRSNFRDMTNAFSVEELADGQWSTLPGLSNDFVYGEYIHAAYAMLANKVKRFAYQLGLRAELSDISTRLLQTAEVNDRNYHNLFPSTHFSYSLSERSNLQIGYSRRVRRPRYWDLNPFFTFMDNRNFRSGNPNLDPEFTDAYELGYVRNLDKATFLATTYYRYTTGKIEQIRTVGEDGFAYIRPENLATEHAFGAEFNISYRPFEWWNFDVNANFFRAITDGRNLGQSFQSDTYTWTARLNSKFILWKKTDLQLRGNYEAPQLMPQGRRQPIYFFDLAMSRDLLKNNATLTLSVNDVLNSRRWRSIITGDNFYTSSDMQWRVRQVNLTFSYRLNQSKRQARRSGGDFEGGGGDF
ncbi:MAG: outer membrane beta-barrel family protein [Bacteroidia bacterium]